MSGVSSKGLLLHHHHGDESGDDIAGHQGGPDADPDELRLTTVGIDVGSSTSHLMFADLTLRRLATSLSSRYVVTERTVRWRSPVILTPFCAEGVIDAEALRTFVVSSYEEAGLLASDVDSGAVILTGEALRRRNARAIADSLATSAGSLVCASAGHHLEAVLAAHGSGAVAQSSSRQGARLHLDIGGGTTKLALVRNGEVVGTSAVAVGGRLIAYDEERRLIRVEETLRPVLELCGLSPKIGDRLEVQEEEMLAKALSDVLVDAIEGRWEHGVLPRLLLTEPLEGLGAAVALSFSGGVAEYLGGVETPRYGDLSAALAGELEGWLTSRGIEVIEAPQRIRATVIGASQFSVQVSGNTVGVDEEFLPVRNLAVVRLDVPAEPLAAAEAESSLTSALRRLDEGTDELLPVAIGVCWQGPPSYTRLAAVASGLGSAWRASGRGRRPMVVVVDADIGSSLALNLRALHPDLPSVSVLDGVVLAEMDFIDVGAVLRPAGVVPVVVRSLLFSG